MSYELVRDFVLSTNETNAPCQNVYMFCKTHAIIFPAKVSTVALLHNHYSMKAK